MIIGQALGVQPRIVDIPSDLIAIAAAGARRRALGRQAVSVLFDNSKIRRFVPGFAPRVSFAEGIRRSLAWFDAYPERKGPIPRCTPTWYACLGSGMGRWGGCRATLRP